MNAYLILAQRKTFEMDITEMALKNARTLAIADEEEGRLIEQRMDAEKLLSSWKRDRAELFVQYKSRKYDYERLVSQLHTMNKSGRQGFVEAALNPEYHAIFKMARLAKSVKEKIMSTIYDMDEAIEYLESFLYSEESERVEWELPFESSNWGIVAQSSPAPSKFSTPQQAAMLVNVCIENSLPQIREEYKYMRDRAAKIDNAALYDILFALCEDEFEAHPIGAEELDRSVYLPEWNFYRNIIIEALYE